MKHTVLRLQNKTIRFQSETVRKLITVNMNFDDICSACHILRNNVQHLGSGWPALAYKAYLIKHEDIVCFYYLRLRYASTFHPDDDCKEENELAF